MTSFFTPKKHNKQLMLYSAEDWPGWIEMIHTQAILYGVWEYIDLEKPADELKQLSTPQRPQPNTIFPSQ